MYIYICIRSAIFFAIFFYVFFNVFFMYFYFKYNFVATSIVFLFIKINFLNLFLWGGHNTTSVPFRLILCSVVTFL